MSVEIPSDERESTPAPTADGVSETASDGRGAGATGHGTAVDVGGMFERVLVVADGEATGRTAVDAAIDLAATHGASVDALFVVDTTEHWDMAVERRERAGEAAVESAADRGARADVDVRKRFRYGTAHEEVVDYAATHDVDAIVVGSARRTGLDRLVNPETLPVRVQRGASCPVLVVGVDDV